MIHIGYESQKWEKICTNSTQALKLLKNPILVNLLFERLEHVSAFNVVSEIPMGGKKDWHPLKGNRKNQWSITIEKPYVICFKPHGNYEVDENGSVRPNTVNELLVTYVGDYHPRRKNA